MTRTTSTTMTTIMAKNKISSAQLTIPLEDKNIQYIQYVYIVEAIIYHSEQVHCFNPHRILFSNSIFLYYSRLIRFMIC